MSYLTGPLYSKVLKKIHTARSTGDVTSVALIQQRICLVKVCPPMMYHVGILAVSEGGQRIFEHGPVAFDSARDLVKENTIFIPLPSVANSLEDLEQFQATLPKKYVMGVRDCRHHVVDILDYLYD